MQGDTYLLVPAMVKHGEGAMKCHEALHLHTHNEKKLDPIKRQCKEMFTFQCQLQQNAIKLQQHTMKLQTCTHKN